MKVNSRSSYFIFLISWLICLLHFSLFTSAEKPCKIDKPFPNVCGENASCEQTNGKDGVCKCSQEFHLEGDKCVLIPVPAPFSSSSRDGQDLNSGSSAAWWILVPCFIMLLAGTAFFLAKRLKLIEKLYQFRVRRYNTVFVTSLQDDDAPIT